MEKILKALGRPLFLLENKSQRISFVNGPGEELIGAAAEEILGRGYEDFFDDSSKRRIEALMELLEKDGAVEGRKEIHLTLRRRTGRPVAINLTLTPFLQEAVPAWLFDLEDLSPVLELQKEKELLVTEMTRVSKLADIGRLTGGIAHELNNPLAILQGLIENVDILIEEGNLTPENLRRDLKPMQETLTRMIRIIRSMMGVARGEEPSMEILPVTEVWERAAVSFAALDEFRGIDLQIRLNPMHLIPVDSIRIEQVLINLVKNALYALEEVPAGQRRIEVDSAVTRDQVVVTVQNNGPSIPASATESIFTPFYTTKPIGKGTGLGLFLCYNIMKAHGGGMSFENLAPQGVRFKLSFPRKSN